LEGFFFARDNVVGSVDRIMSHQPPAIVETVMTADVASLRAGRDRAVSADLVELRLDGLDQIDVTAALAGRARPVIVTCRAAWEGGRFRGSEEERVRILAQALAEGAEFVDIEWRAEAAAHLITPATRDRIVLSMHDFETTPADLAERVREMRRSSAGTVKAAAHTHRLADLLPLLSIGREAARDGQRTVLIGMGPAGVLSRVLPARFGSCWTYGGPAVAPGQVTVSRLVHEFRVRLTRPTTPVYAVVGNPISHSVSPAMHNAAFEALGIDGVYVPCEAADFEDFDLLADALSMVGASVTAPFKEAAWAAQRRDRRDAARSATAAAVATRDALNTLRRAPDGSWEGLNTDVEGFLAPLADVALEGQRVAVLGAGGAARAVVTGLLQRGARVTLHARRGAAAEALAHELGVEAGSWPPDPDAWDVLVNTTPVGTFPDGEATPIASGLLTGGLVYDLVYNPRPTRLLRDAAARGARTIDGLEMLVEQARRQFAWWTGVMPPGDVMRRAADARLEAMAGERALAAVDRR
jgi:3-dehydroquinate dehydratase / shikimate dehydrogenase